MAYEIGTALNYKDLLARLQDFLNNPGRAIGSGDASINELSAMPSGEFWTIRRWDTNFDADNGWEMILEGPGTSGQDEIFIGIQTYYHAGNDYYNWKLNGMTGYVSAAAMENQPGSVQGCWPRILLWNDPIDYWFLGNGRRFVVIAKVSNIYEMLYMGFALPYGLPNQFPYPLVIGGSYSYASGDNPRYSSTAPAHRGFASPYGYATGVCSSAVDNQALGETSSLKILKGTSWNMMRNRYTDETLYQSNSIWPYSASTYSYNDNIPYNIFSRGLRENIDGSYPIFPLIMMLKDPNDHIFGELQGCFAVPGFGGIAAEDTFTVNGDTYIAFPIVANAARGDFMCIKKE